MLRSDRPSRDVCRGRLPARWLRALLGALLATSASRVASATPEYPLVVDSVIGVDPAIGTNCPNPLSRCLICHTTARGGQGTAEQPFAVSLRPYGLNHGNDDNALRTALMRLPDDTDSDGDGVPDKQELKECGNPSGQDLGAGPVYGCDGARLATRGQPDLAFCALALGAALGLIRSRRRLRSRDAAR
jgi:hypothetical protein